MKNFIYILIALTFMALSCERVEIKPEPKVLAEFNAVAEKSNETTKVSIDQNYILSWDQGDRIKVWDGSSELLFIAQEAGKSVSFQAEGVVLVSGQSYAAAYPESMSSFTEEGLKVYVPNIVTTDPAQLPQSPAVARSNGQDNVLEFRNVCGLVSFNVVGDDIVSITVEGANQEVLSGWVSVDPLTGVYDPSTVTEGSASIEISGLLSGLYSGKYYLPLLPQNFEKGLKVTMHTMNGTDIVREFANPFDLKRSYYYDLEGVDQGQYFRYEISTAEQLQQFLDDAKDCESHVVATLLRDIDLKGVELDAAESYKGTFNGNSKKLKNWNATSPLFKTLAQGAVVRNLTIASSCTYTLAETAEPQAFIVGENNGLVNGCTNEASVTYTLSQVETPVSRTFGSIVGVCNSKMTDCTNLGNIDIVLSAQTGAQHIGGVVGTFNSATKSVAVENCTNEGNITIVTQHPHNVNVGGVCAQGCNGAPVAEDEAANAGSISNCVNKGQVSVTASAAYANVGGVIGYVEGNVSSCVNEAAGAVTLVAYEGSAVVAPSVGGVAGTVLAGSVSGSSNAAQVSLEGAVLGAEGTAAYTGGNVNPAVGGVVAKVGKAGEDSGIKVQDCINAGAVSTDVAGDVELNVGGVIGWTSNKLEGSGSKNLLNQGSVTVSNAAGTVNAGGVAGQSKSGYSKIYNTGEVNVLLGQAATAVRVGGAVGYLSGSTLAAFLDDSTKQPNHIVTGQNEGSITVSGGTTVTDRVYVGGVIGLSDVKNMSHNQTSWDLSNSNMGNITVNSPVSVVVGGAIAKESGIDIPITNVVGKRAVSGAKNRGDITVTNPGKDSYVGGLVGWHGRGMIGNANNVGRYSASSTSTNDKVTITVTGADATTCVGAVVGYLSSNNGAAWGSSTVISGCGIYCDISAVGATAALIVGKANFAGSSAVPCFMLGSSSTERPKYHVNCQLNGTAIGALSDGLDITRYFGSVQKNGSDVTPEFRTCFAGSAMSTPENCLQTY